MAKQHPYDHWGSIGSLKAQHEIHQNERIWISMLDPLGGFSTAERMRNVDCPITNSHDSYTFWFNALLS